jgi:metal-responsive CopG/Arc/MetJ family transcriptional regulator
MRTLVDIEDKDIEALDEIAARSNQSRAALIRAAIAAFLGQYRNADETGAFGLWGKRQVDGLTYQKKMRAEW